MVPVSAVIIGFIALMGLFTFGSGEVKEQRLEIRVVDVEQSIEESAE